MTDDPRVARLRIQIGAGEDADPEDIDRLTRSLREEIAQLDVESAELAASAMPPPGAKSAEALALGAIWVGLVPSLVPGLVEFLQAWALRGANRTVKVSARVGERALEVEYAPGLTSKAEVKHLIGELTDMLAELPGTSREPSRS
jgi:hypothetical protein